MLVAVISDTHMPKGRRQLPDSCLRRLTAADLILHAGDIVSEHVLAELEAIGRPVAAVHGNMDSEELRRQLPAERELDLGGVRIGMVHDAGPAEGRLERLRLKFPAAHAVVFGHSHIPLHQERDGFHIFNPGSPTDRRKQPCHTMGLATIDNGSVSFELLPLD
jgi:putative phosphoesterase